MIHSCAPNWYLACLDVLRVIVLGDTDVDGPSIANVNVYVGSSHMASQGPDKKDPKVVKTLPLLCQSASLTIAPCMGRLIYRSFNVF